MTQTIIECLRYITCGGLPPGTGNGKAFLTDPKLVNRSEVTATIKLKFFAINKQSILCTRTMNLRRKNNKLEFKKLEQILKTKTSDGKDVTIAHSANEIDRQVPELLGVSRAVLENVIFCHQEESLWPFRDNATLKSIFDELFETTKFTKLYETLSRLHKDNKKKFRDERSALDLSKMQYETLVGDMKGLQSVIQDIRNNMNRIKLEKKRKDELQQVLRRDNYEERMHVINKDKALNEYKLEEARKVLNVLLEKLADEEHQIDQMSPDDRQQFLNRLIQDAIVLTQDTDLIKEQMASLEVRYK